MIAAENVRVQCVRAIGRPEDLRSLVRESQRAAMVCIGARPRHAAIEPVIGAVAAALARGAACPVAVIRTRSDGGAHRRGHFGGADRRRR